MGGELLWAGAGIFALGFVAGSLLAVTAIVWAIQRDPSWWHDAIRRWTDGP
jgi:hypothetical protein